MPQNYPWYEVVQGELKKMENEKILNESCKHYDREEINVVIDGKTKPILKCKDCGKILNGEKK